MWFTGFHKHLGNKLLVFKRIFLHSFPETFSSFSFASVLLSTFSAWWWSVPVTLHLFFQWVVRKKELFGMSHYPQHSPLWTPETLSCFFCHLVYTWCKCPLGMGTDKDLAIPNPLSISLITSIPGEFSYWFLLALFWESPLLLSVMSQLCYIWVTICAQYLHAVWSNVWAHQRYFPFLFRSLLGL